MLKDTERKIKEAIKDIQIGDSIFIDLFGGIKISRMDNSFGKKRFKFSTFYVHEPSGKIFENKYSGLDKKELYEYLDNRLCNNIVIHCK